MRTKGKDNYLIEQYIEDGMRLNGDNEIIMPDGRKAQTYLSNGYMTIGMSSRDKKTRRKVNVARIICWLVYGAPPKPNYNADHINRDRLDDRPENLRWASNSTNAKNQDFVAHMEKRSNVSLNEKKIVEIISLWKKGLKRKEIVTKTGITNQSYDKLIYGRSWRFLAVVRKNIPSSKPSYQR